MRRLSDALGLLRHDIERAEAEGRTLTLPAELMLLAAPLYREMVDRAKALEAAEAERDALRRLVDELLTASAQARAAADSSVPIRRAEVAAEPSNIVRMPIVPRPIPPEGGAA